MSPKDWATLRARAALKGVVLYRSDNRDGNVLVFAVAEGRVRRWRIAGTTAAAQSSATAAAWAAAKQTFSGSSSAWRTVRGTSPTCSD